MIAEDPVTQRVVELARRVAKTDTSVMITGESGVGKEVFFRLIHRTSRRAGREALAINCAAIPDNMLEAVLFGHEKGAFTGAYKSCSGKFEQAQGSTLLLDEVSEMSLPLQAKLLRVLQERQVERVGGSSLIDLDVRVIATSNRDLAGEVRTGRFREDLYYRLAGLKIELPSLAQRPEDIPALVEHFLRLEAGPDRAPRRIARPVLAALSRRPWPGNVRELKNQVARLCVLSEGDLVDPALISLPGPQAQGAPPGLPNLASGPLPTLAELERLAIECALELAQGDKSRAADLGISRAKVYQRLKEWRSASAAGEGTADEAPDRG
jgi:two-component system response regulator FlrC